jgi:ABC-type phosphate transport system permease subunit
MSLATSSNVNASRAGRSRTRARSMHAAGSQLAQGESLIWLSGGALTVSLFMILGILLLVACQGMQTFWPKAVVQIQTLTKQTIVGEILNTESYVPTADTLTGEISAELQAGVEQQLLANKGQSRRRLVRLSRLGSESGKNQWVSDFVVQEETTPEWLVVIERLSGGRIYGQPVGYIHNDQKTMVDTPAEAWQFFQEHHSHIRQQWRKKKEIETYALGRLSAEIQAARLAVRTQELDHGTQSAEFASSQTKLQEVESRVKELSADKIAEIEAITQDNNRFQWLLNVGGAQPETVPLEEIVRAYAPNRMSLWGKLSLYVERWWEFVSEEPRAVNTEGGVMPAIFGTVAMTLIMSLVVAPFGVLAALYLREYAKSGITVSLIRIAINNLSGVPSIVFGVFGFGFFCCQVGAFIDGGPRHALIPVLPSTSWYLLLFALAVVAVLAFLSAVLTAAVRNGERTARQRWIASLGGLLWVAATIMILVLIAMSPFFDGFFRASLPAPTFGTGGILWGALTLALLTLPVVITATEEALSAVPNSLREGSYACGAGKWQTIRRIVLPHAMPGIMTGMILALSRGAGEVAPLMMVGAIKFAPKLPIDGEYPYVHAQRSFMHLAYHIFDLGFHSPDSESAKPTIYTTILLLIVIVVVLNLMAVWLRQRMRKAFAHGQF